MESRLYSWFCAQRSRHVPISYEILAVKAKQFYKGIYGKDNFEASRGWIANFKCRHGLRAIKICGEKLSNDQTSVAPFIATLKAKVDSLNLTATQVYNADESALFWKMLPEKTMVRFDEKTAPGRKVSKERVTFLACTNADGSHKLKLLVIGKSKNPRAFKNVDLPVEYKNSKNAWMTFAIFREWFLSSFVRQVRCHLKRKNLPERAVLLVDNASSHGGNEELSSEDGNFTIMFLPPNCTALIQPLDQNAIRLTKLFYRKSLLAHILSKEEEEVITCLKNLNLKDAVCFLANSWQKVSSEVIQKCWENILPTESDSNTDCDSEDSIPLSRIRQTILQASEERTVMAEMLNRLCGENVSETDINQWIDNDASLLPLETVDLENTSEQESDEEDSQSHVGKTVKNDEAVKCFSLCLQWAEENDVPFRDILVLQRLKEMAFLANHKQVKQTKITNYFSNA